MCGIHVQDAKNFAEANSIDFVDGARLEALIVRPKEPFIE
jgi:hypothetical protein